MPVVVHLNYWPLRISLLLVQLEYRPKRMKPRSVHLDHWSSRVKPIVVHLDHWPLRVRPLHGLEKIKKWVSRDGEQNHIRNKFVKFSALSYTCNNNFEIHFIYSAAFITKRVFKFAISLCLFKSISTKHLIDFCLYGVILGSDRCVNAIFALLG
jgi:hypothetical protein